MYAAAVFGNRILAFFNLLILAYLLRPAEFGAYALMATNALVLQLVFGSWMSASVSKYLSLAKAGEAGAVLANARAGLLALAAAAVVLSAGLLLLPRHAIEPAFVAAVLAWAVALATYEVTLSAKNALGRAGEYAALAIFRNMTALALSVAAAAAGLGALGAAAGQVIGTLLPSIALPSSFALWRRAVDGRASWGALRTHFAFGLGGMVAFGLYVLFSMTTRNLVGLYLGEAAAGRLSLATDLFYVPLALLINVLFLGKTPALYALAADGAQEAEKRRQVTLIVKGVALIVLPYLIGGLTVAQAASALVLPGDVGRGVAPLAPAATLFGAAFAVLYASTTLFLVLDHRRWLVGVASGAIAANILLLVAASRLGSVVEALWLSSGVVAAFAVLSCVVVMVREKAAPEAAFWLRLAAAALPLWVVVAGMSRFGALASLGAVPVGAAVYAAASRLLTVLRPDEWRGLVRAGAA